MAKKKKTAPEQKPVKRKPRGPYNLTGKFSKKKKEVKPEQQPEIKEEPNPEPQPEIKEEIKQEPAPKPEPEHVETPVTDESKQAEDSFENFLNEYKQEKTETEAQNGEDLKNEVKGEQAPTEQPKPKADLSKVINGKMLLMLMNFIMPAAIKFLFGLFDKRAKKVSINDIALDQGQIEILSESADLVAVYIFEKANPMVIFFICSGAMYGANFAGALQEIPKENEKTAEQVEIQKLLETIANQQTEILNLKKKK